MKYPTAIRKLHETFGTQSFHVAQAMECLGFSHSWTVNLIRQAMTHHKYPKVAKSTCPGFYLILEQEKAGGDGE